ncbi:MAG TPA: acyltransferase [Labilithrix sp.]|nr:acyltransferase [Labilithrix sp.]
MDPSEVLAQEVRAALARLWLRSSDRVGRGSRLRGRPFVRNLGRMEIGDDFVASSIPVRTHLVTGPKGVLRIGNRVRIAHGASISAQAELIIGDDCVIGPFAMLIDSDYHDASDRRAVAEAKPIHIGRGVRIGAGVVILRGAVIGDGAVIEPRSVVSRYIPAGAHAAGVPARPVIARMSAPYEGALGALGIVK